MFRYKMSIYLESSVHIPLVCGEHGDGVLPRKVALAHQLLVLDIQYRLNETVARDFRPLVFSTNRPYIVP
jgi:hypothetical protein